jgi:hypothetical protein
MSAKELKDKEPEREARPAKKPEEAAAPQDAGAAKKALGYTFKFAPADPKNAFDFEDVADK